MLQQYNVTRKVLQHIDTVTTHFQRGDVSALNSAIAAWTPGNTARAPAPARAHALFWVEKIHQLNTDTGATVNAATYATNEPTS